MKDGDRDFPRDPASLLPFVCELMPANQYQSRHAHTDRTCKRRCRCRLRHDRRAGPERPRRRQHRPRARSRHLQDGDELNETTLSQLKDVLTE
jgi:hypothetical protein